MARTDETGEATIYHNPRCSKSRNTLALLQSRGVSPRIVEYLVTPPDESTLRNLLRQLGGVPAREVIRRNEPLFTTLGLEAHLDDDDALLRAMAAHPALIERPLVVVGDRARIGRPPENVLELLSAPARPAETPHA